MRRRILSFDLDNCLFHCGYSEDPHRDEMEVINTNKTLLDSIITDRAHFDELIVMVGSARQSELDNRNCCYLNQTESGYTAIQKVSTYISAKLDTFLLADVYGNVPDGTAYHNALNSSYRGTHHGWIYDESKITILYAQIHKIANLYPDDEITFDFYDDKGKGSWRPIDILEHLETYFTRHATMLPSNVTLNLNHYEGEAVTSFKPIRGTGQIDINYRQTIKEMTVLARKAEPLPSDLNFFSKSVFHVTPEQLVNRKGLSIVRPNKQNSSIAEQGTRHSTNPSFALSLFKPQSPLKNLGGADYCSSLRGSGPQKWNHPKTNILSLFGSMSSLFRFAHKKNLSDQLEQQDLKIRKTVY